MVLVNELTQDLYIFLSSTEGKPSEGGPLRSQLKAPAPARLEDPRGLGPAEASGPGPPRYPKSWPLDSAFWDRGHTFWLLWRSRKASFPKHNDAWRLMKLSNCSGN